MSEQGKLIEQVRIIIEVPAGDTSEERAIDIIAIVRADGRTRMATELWERADSPDRAAERGNSMTTVEQEVRNAIDSMAEALRDHYEYGPNYDDATLRDIERRLGVLKQRLAAMEREDVTHE